MLLSEIRICNLVRYRLGQRIKIQSLLLVFGLSNVRENKMAKFFTAEGLVIITSKDEVSAFQWRKYIEKNWDDLKQKNAVMLILAGIHGKQDGKLGNPDLGLLKDYQGQIDYFMGKSKKQPPEKIRRDISNLNIQVSIV